MPLSDDFPEGPVSPRMTLLAVMSRCPLTEAVFAAYENQAGVCLRCQALFDSVEEVALKYKLDLKKLLGDLNALIRALESGSQG